VALVLVEQPLGAHPESTVISNRYLFTGREWEEANSLYCYRARHYHPTLDRFLQPDPIGYAGGDINIYR
jgi:RHS repeat-associated protein